MKNLLLTLTAITALLSTAAFATADAMAKAVVASIIAAQELSNEDIYKALGLHKLTKTCTSAVVQDPITGEIFKTGGCTWN